MFHTWMAKLFNDISVRGRIKTMVQHVQRKETTDFLSPQVKVVELDVDPDREPDVLADGLPM